MASRCQAWKNPGPPEPQGKGGLVRETDHRLRDVLTGVHSLLQHALEVGPWASHLGPLGARPPL